MRVRMLVLSSVVFITLIAPFLGKAAVPEPFIYMTQFTNTPGIKKAPYGTYQTAMRTGDRPILLVRVHSQLNPAPVTTADLGLFGLTDGATTTALDAGPAARYPTAYLYNFGPLTIDAGLSDGVYDIPIISTDAVGGVSTANVQLIIDNVPPTIALSGVSFSSDAPQKFDTIYLSGSASGTGSAIRVSSIDQMLVDANGKTLPYGYASSVANHNIEALNSAFTSSTDGTFTQVPIQLFWGDDSAITEDAASFRIDIATYDEAGLAATTTLSVPFPHPPPPDPCIAAGNCVSSVLFLPGIEGSRLYEGSGCIANAAEEKLWEPFDSIWSVLRGAGDGKMRKLFLDASGESVCSDVYAKADDIIGSAGGNIYQSFIDEMNGMKSDGIIADWKPVAYDWRLSLTNLLNNGTERGGKIYYEESTSTPYIEQTLRALAANSKTGRVTIVSHSNGGLVAKALLNRLGGQASKSLVDKIIMVGAPQSGAPEGLGALLVGHDAGIYKYGFPIISNAAARELALNSPMAYHLLPSDDYLKSIAGDANHPVGRFAGDAYATEISVYGPTIESLSELDDFILARDGGREKPAASDTSSPEIGNAALIDYANSQHAALDSWTPPDGIEVDQIAGWGSNTVAGIEFYTSPAISALTSLGPVGSYRPIFTEDGDGTVPVPSALMMATSTNVNRYWVDLFAYNNETDSDRKHKDLFEIPQLEEFIRNIIENSTSTLPAYIETTQPSPETVSKKLTFYLHSPLTLQLTDASGNVTGLAEDGSMTQDIPDSTYGEFGEVKYVTVPQGSQYTLTLHGQDTGTFSLDIQESSGGVVTNSSTLANVPTTPNTLASLTISDGIDTASALTADQNGDGTDIVSLAPMTGATVNYEPPVSEPDPVLEPVITSAGGSVPVSTIVSTPSPDKRESRATTTEASVVVVEPVATTSREVSILPVQPREKPRVSQRPAVPESVVKVANSLPDLSQSASVYGASQQPVVRSIGTMIYNVFTGLWHALKKFL